MIQTIDQLFDQIVHAPKRKLVIANGVDAHSIEAAHEAIRLGIVEVILLGDAQQIENQCNILGLQVSQFHVVDEPDENRALVRSMEFARSGEAHLVMKGLVSTDRFMKAILNKEIGLLPPKTLLSHITLMQHSNYHKLLLVSDVAIIPFPNLEQKKIMTTYLLNAARRLGNLNPKVAFIAATEQVINAMPACTDAVVLKTFFAEQNEQCDGPMGLDLAIDREAVKIKNFKSDVAGDADCLLFPNIEAGNVFYKTVTKLCNAETAAVVVGTRVPVVLSSRGDTMRTKLNSIALAALLGSY
jgi:phosphotransacetylase